MPYKATKITWSNNSVMPFRLQQYTGQRARAALCLLGLRYSLACSVEPRAIINMWTNIKVPSTDRIVETLAIS
jgi:hypothetical protein